MNKNGILCVRLGSQIPVSLAIIIVLCLCLDVGCSSKIGGELEGHPHGQSPGERSGRAGIDIRWGKGVPAFMCEIIGICDGIVAYRRFYGMYPTGDSTNISHVLQGNNPNHKIYTDSRMSVGSSGELLDYYGMPYRILIFSNGYYEVRSAGPNKRFDDADDFYYYNNPDRPE